MNFCQLFREKLQTVIFISTYLVNSTLGNKNAITFTLNDSLCKNILFFELSTKFFGDVSILIRGDNYLEPIYIMGFISGQSGKQVLHL